MEAIGREQTADGAFCVVFPNVLGWQVSVLVAHDRGRPVIGGMTVLPADATYDSPASPPSVDWSDALAVYALADPEPTDAIGRLRLGTPPEGGLTAHGLRALPLGALFSQAQELVIDVLPYPMETGYDVSAWHEGLRANPKGRPELNRLFLAKVARDYVRLRGTGKPNAALAVMYDRPTSTVADWVLKARDRGLLSEATKGVAAGFLTPEAEELLANEGGAPIRTTKHAREHDEGEK